MAIKVAISINNLHQFRITSGPGVHSLRSADVCKGTRTFEGGRHRVGSSVFNLSLQLHILDIRPEDGSGHNFIVTAAVRQHNDVFDDMDVADGIASGVTGGNLLFRDGIIILWISPLNKMPRNLHSL